MITIVSGTNRKNSISYKIGVLYQQLLEELGEESEIIDLSELPEDYAFSALYENNGKNEQFNPFRSKMKEAQKLLFILPEYNGSYPGALKTFIDGLEWPDTFTHKKCALIGFSSGVQGGSHALSHLTDVFNYMGMHVLALKLKFGQIEKNITEEPFSITNELYLSLLKQQAEMLVKF